MDKRILIGAIAGIILGIIEKFLFKGGYELLIIPTLLGALIGFLHTQTLKINSYLLGAIAGALFFIVVAFRSGSWLDDIATGAITGLLIAFIIKILYKNI